MFKVFRLVGCMTAALFGASLAMPAGALQPVNPADRALADDLRVGQRSEDRRIDDRRSTLSDAGTVEAHVGDIARSAASEERVIGAIRVTGVERVEARQFAATIQSYLGRSLGREDLARLAGQIADIVRREGYGMATAWVPAQSLDGGILIVQVDAGRIDALRVTGPGAAIVERRLRPLIGRTTVSTAELERRLMIAGDAAGVIVSNVRLVRENGQSILTATARFNHVRGQVALDNWGSTSIGPVRVRADLDINGIVAPGDQFSFGGILTPAQPEELQVLRARYAVSVGGAGTEIAIHGALAHSQAAAGQEGADVLSGTSIDAGVEVSRALQRSRQGGLWAFARVGLYDSRLSFNKGLIYDDRIVTAGLSLSGNQPLLGGRAWARVGFTTGLDILGATRADDPLASRYDADGTFWVMDYSASLDRALGQGFSVRIATEGQISSGPLLSAWEYGLGGRFFVRGFDFREFAGDEGAAGSLELRYDVTRLPSALRRIQLYGFVDGGRVFNGEGRHSADLASAGGGIRMTTRGGVFGSLETGVPLTPGYFGRTPDPRISFSLNIGF